MNQQSRFTFSRRNAIFLGLCLGGFVLLLIISVIPLKIKDQALDLESTALKEELARQRQNEASIAMVDAILATLDQQPSPEVVALSPLPQEKTDQLVADLRTIARESALKISTIDPLLDKKKSWQTLTVRAELTGLFPELRSFLLKLLALPYVRQIDRIEIHPGDARLNFSLTYTIDLA